MLLIKAKSSQPYSERGRRRILDFCSASCLISARRLATPSISRSEKVSESILPAADCSSRKPRHSRGNSCREMPYLRARLRSTPTVTSWRV